MKFREHFREIMARSGLPSYGYVDDLAARYEGQDRWYHNKCHIVSVIERIYDLAEVWQWEDRDRALIAALYHDAVYVPGWKNNELQSAILMRGHLQSMDAKPQLYYGVERCILATKDHQPDAKAITSSAILIDADLYELATDKYEYNSRRVRREFGDIEEDAWIEGRKKFLMEFLLRNKIYHLHNQHELEVAARTNMENELVRLINGDGASEVHDSDSAEG